ncbi:hypothetical protein [Spirosoma aerophilum]
MKSFVIICLVNLTLAFKVQGQDNYYSRPTPKRITAYVGLNFQALSPFSKYAISNVRGEGQNLQLGAIYNIPISGKLSLSPELAIRQNGADLTYRTPILDTYEYHVKGFSTQIFLPVKRTFQVSKISSIGIAGGLFLELPVNVRVTEDLIQWDPNNWMYRLPVTNSVIHGIAKGWQIVAEYNITSFQMRLYLADRGVIGQDIIHVPSTRITGFTFGVSF